MVFIWMLAGLYIAIRSLASPLASSHLSLLYPSVFHFLCRISDSALPLNWFFDLMWRKNSAWVPGARSFYHSTRSGGMAYFFCWHAINEWLPGGDTSMYMCPLIYPLIYLSNGIVPAKLLW